MSLRETGFKLDRTHQSRISLASVNRDPDLSTLLRSKAETGPLKGAAISAPRNWDGVCRPGKDQPPYPGHYKWKFGKWVWKEDKNNA